VIRNFKIVIFSIILALNLFLIQLPALSHPHVQVELFVKLRVEDNKLTEITPNMKFDQRNSEQWIKVLEHFKFDLTKPIDINQNEEFKREFQYFFPYDDYFSEIKVGGKLQKIKGIKDIEINVINEAFFLSYTLIFDPVDLSKENVSASFYDAGYYYNILFSKENPVTFVKNATTDKYGYRITANLDHAYYLDQSHPQQVEIVLNKKF